MKTETTSKGDWIFERSSGYAGWRCLTCNTWIYNNQVYKCKCDNLKEGCSKC